LAGCTLLSYLSNGTEGYLSGAGISKTQLAGYSTNDERLSLITEYFSEAAIYDYFTHYLSF